jgi:hypothetical protein
MPGMDCTSLPILRIASWPVHLLVLQHQLAEMGHGNLPVTHTYTSNERQPPLRSAHAKRSPPGGYVLTGQPEVSIRRIVTCGLPTIGSQNVDSRVLCVQERVGDVLFW